MLASCSYRIWVKEFLGSYNFNLLSVLALSDLSSTFLVQVSMLDAHLELLKLVGAFADHFLFAEASLVGHLEFCHLAGKPLLHLGDVESAALRRVEVSILESRSHLITV